MKSMFIMKPLAVIFIIILVIGFRGYVYGYEEIDVKDGGSISGTVKFVGEKIPEVKTITVNKDKEVCGAEPKHSEKFVINPENKGIRYVVVSIEGIEKGKKAEVPAEGYNLPQRKCWFEPHVMAVPAGATVSFPNNVDKVMHNLHSYTMPSNSNRPFNKGVPFKGTFSVPLKKPGLVKMTCDVHKWMLAWIVVKDSPYYAISDENGNYKIEDIPPGTYNVQAWHEALGRRENIGISVKANGDTKVDFQLKKKKKRKRKKKKKKKE
ncbi:MAG: carboxypeptidase regulatory-like domain-containing protein [Candidatus Scalindua sp.]